MRNILDPSGKHRRQFVTWLLLACSGVVPVIAILAIHALRDRIELAHHAQIALAQILADSNELETKEYKAFASERLDANQSKQIERYIAKVSLDINELIRLHPAEPQLRKIASDFETYTRNMREEFRLLMAGEVAAAKAQNEEKVDPVFAELHKLIEDTDPIFSAAADRTAQVVEVGSAVVTLFACALMGFLLWRLRAAESAVIDQTSLQAANEKLRNEVAERKRAEARLRLQSVALEAAANAIVITDPKGNILWVNSAFTSLTGYTPKEVIGQNSRILKSGKQDETLYANLWETVTSGQVWQGEIVNRRKDGSLYTEEMTITPVRNSCGEISRFIAIKQDITARKQIEEALHEMQRQQRALLENIPDVAWVKDKESCYVAVNEPTCKAYGRSPEEIIGKTDFDMVPADLAERYRADDKCVMESRERKRIEEPFEDATGHRTWLDTIKSPIINNRGEVIGTAGISRDITERKKGEEALQNSEAQYRALIETTNTGYAIVDHGGKVLDANAEYVRLAGHHNLDEILGRSVIEWTADYEKEKNAEAVGKCFKCGYIRDLEIDYVDSRGKVTPVEINATVVKRDGTPRILALCRDITERKKVEETLRTSEERYRGLFETMREGFALCEIICDTAGKPCDFRYLEVNSTFEEIGIKRGEAVGKTARELFPEIEDYWIDTYGQVALTRTPVHFENYLRALDKHFEVAAFSPKPGQFAAMFMDITERKRAEHELEATNKRLSNALIELKAAQEQTVQQERLRALGTMASGIAHDFNNSLTAILGYTELLLHWPDALDDKEQARSYIEIMNTTARDAGKIVDRLREFYRYRDEAEVFALVDVNQLVTEAVALTQPRWKAEAEAHGVSVNVRTDLLSIPPVGANAANIREALTNLIFNAVDAMPHGGTITIRTRCDAGHVVLEVADTGTGMTEEVRRRCLEPFFSTKGERGTGLGLSMVYGIVQRHEGMIDIQSEIGKGTTFIISLPHRAISPQTLERGEQPANSIQSLRVLVVDDEPLVRKIIGEYLKLDGHVVEIADNGRTGLEKFRSGRFDLVLVDRAMPDMSGDQVATAIKSVSPTMPVVMLTGFGAMMDAADEKPVDVDLVIAKPVTIAGLRLALAKVTTPGTQDVVVPQDALATDAAFLQ